MKKDDREKLCWGCWRGRFLLKLDSLFLLNIQLSLPMSVRSGTFRCSLLLHEAFQRIIAMVYDAWARARLLLAETLVTNHALGARPSLLWQLLRSLEVATAWGVWWSKLPRNLRILCRKWMFLLHPLMPRRRQSLWCLSRPRQLTNCTLLAFFVER